MSRWTKWRPFTHATLAVAPRYQGNYQIAFADDDVEYEHGVSKIIYIGKASAANSSIRTRLRAHYGGRGSAVIAELLDEGVELEARWRADDDPDGSECALFEDFKDEFGELPVANMKGCRTEDVLDRLENDDDDD